MRKILVLCLLLAYTIVFAQDTTHNKKLKYFGLHQIGLLAGSSSEKVDVLTTNGVHKGNWYAGISTGIDWYGIRSIPLLAGVHKAFGKSRHQPFIYGNAGIAFVWEDDYRVSFGSGFYDYDFKNGFASEAGVGYFVNLKNQTALSLSAGFSYKEMSLHETQSIGGFTGNIILNHDYKYYYRRIAIKIGLKI